MEIRIVRSMDRESCEICALGLEVHVHALRGDSLWVVPSLSRFGESYEVGLSEPVVGECTCPHGQHFNPCRCVHVRLAHALCPPDQHPGARQLLGLSCMVQLALGIEAIGKKAGVGLNIPLAYAFNERLRDMLNGGDHTPGRPVELEHSRRARQVLPTRTLEPQEVAA